MALIRPLTAWLLSVLLLCASEPSARELYKRGRQMEELGQIANAYLLYAQAAAAAPERTEYWRRAQALQRKAVSEAGSVMQVQPAASTTAEGDAKVAPLPPLEPEDLARARRPQPPAELKAEPGQRSFRLNAPARQLWQEVAKTFGLDVIFEGDYPESGPAIRFTLDDVDYRTALYALGAATQSFIVPVSAQLMMIAQDTEQKRRDVENTIAISIPIPEAVTLQEAQELARTVQQVMEIQKFGIDSVSRVAVLRDRVSKVVPAQILFQQLLAPKGQIVLEVKLISLDRSRSWQIGLDLPNTFRITSRLSSMPFTKWSTGAFGLSLAAATALLRGNRSSTETLYETQLRTVDGQPVTFNYGTKYPITTLTYIGEVPDGEQAFIPPPNFTFEDLGLSLKVTPKVHSDEDVTLDFEASFKLLKGDSLNGIPVIVNRQVKTQTRVPFAGAAVVAGLVSDTDLDSLSGPAGLLNIPILGTLLGRRNLSKEHIQLLLVVRPRLITLPISEETTQAIWLGPDTRPRLPL